MGVAMTGRPFVGSISLTNGAPGALPIPVYTTMGTAAHVLAANERLYITNISIGSNNTAAILVTLDTGGTTPTKLVSNYFGGSTIQPPMTEQIPMGACSGRFGGAINATASPAPTGAFTVEVIIKGFIANT